MASDVRRQLPSGWMAVSVGSTWSSWREAQIGVAPCQGEQTGLLCPLLNRTSVCSFQRCGLGLAVLTHLPHSRDPVNGKVLLRRLSSSSCAWHGCNAVPPSACRAVSQAFCSSSEDT